MRTILLVVLLAVTGCERPPEATQYIPALSVIAAYSTLTEGGEGPVDPVPDSDVCTNCNGTGKLGDGTVFVDCPMCEDGKVTAGEQQCQCGPNCPCRVVTLHPDTIKALAAAIRRELQREDTPHPVLADPPVEQPRRRVFTDYDQGAALAASLDQPLLLTFSQPNCAPCVKLDNLQQTPAVDDYLMKFIQVKLDTSREPGVLQKWSVRSTPTEIVRHHGREVARHSGITTLDPYLSWLMRTHDSALRVPVPR